MIKLALEIGTNSVLKFICDPYTLLSNNCLIDESRITQAHPWNNLLRMSTVIPISNARF